MNEDRHIHEEEEAVLAKIIHARPTNILILRKISLCAAAADIVTAVLLRRGSAAEIILAATLSVVFVPPALNAWQESA